MKSENILAAINRIPQQANMVFTYSSGMGNNKWLSFVDVTLNSNNPCADPAVAAASADSQHSGVCQAGGSDRIVTVPQTILLDTSKIYTTCYATVEGTQSDISWRDSYIRLEVSKIYSISTAEAVHYTSVNVPSLATLHVTYAGSLPFRKWIAVVDQTLNTNLPCADPAVPSNGADSSHSGPKRAGVTDSIATIDTSSFTMSKTYAVCYSDDTGDIDGTWQDSGIRVALPKVTHLTYSSPTRTMPADNIRPGSNVIPQATVSLTYHGTLANNKWISLVDSTFHGNSPCIHGPVAAASADSKHTGKIQAGTSNKVISVSQSGATLLATDKVFAVCYAETSGLTNDATWTDSTLRLRITKLTSLTSYLLTHTTFGHVTAHTAVPMLYAGTLANQMYISLVDATLNSNLPCGTGATAGASADSSHSGPGQAANGAKLVTINLASLDATKNYALCYSEAGGDAFSTWFDSGLRLTVSKIRSISYGTPARVMDSSHVPATTNSIPQMTNVVLTYSGDLAFYNYVSIVSASLNTNDPCNLGSFAAAGADATHSGAVRAGEYDKIVTIPQSTLLDEDTIFAVCYAETDGTTSDATWADSYIRTRLLGWVATSVATWTGGWVICGAALLCRPRAASGSN
jgi:hypothetical protein